MNKKIVLACVVWSVIGLSGCERISDIGLLHDQEKNYVNTQEGKPLQLHHASKSNQYYEVPNLKPLKGEVNPALKPPTRWEESNSAAVTVASGCHYIPLDDQWQVPCSMDQTWTKVLSDLKKAKYQVMSVNPKARQIFFLDVSGLNPVPGRQGTIYLLEFHSLSASNTQFQMFDYQHRAVPLHVMQKLSRYLLKAERNEGWKIQLPEGW